MSNSRLVIRLKLSKMVVSGLWPMGYVGIVTSISWTDHPYTDWIICLDGDNTGNYPRRFKLYKEPRMNGTDAKGNPLNFTEDDLKPFMRVVIKTGESFITVSKDNVMRLLTPYSVHGFIGPNWLTPRENDHAHGEYEITEVYAEPDCISEMLDVTKHGKLIWKRNPQKTAKQIAVEELETSIEASKAKLAELKGMM